MKKLLFYFVFILISTNIFAQDLKSIDSSLKHIDENLGKLKEQLIKEDPKPYAGQSIFEDRKGNTAIFLPSGGTFRLNTADASLKFFFTNRISTNKLFYGFDISGKTYDGIVSLFANGHVSPGTKVNAIFGVQDLFSKSKKYNGWIALKVGYEGALFKIYNPMLNFTDQVTKTTFNSLPVSIAFNLRAGQNKLFGISVGYQKINNYEFLDEIELTDSKTVFDSLSNTTRTYVYKVKARSGNYYTADQVAINYDFLWMPNGLSRLGIYNYWRTKFVNGKMTNGFGSGLYLLKKDNPLSSIAGLVVEVTDVTKLKEGYGKNFTISFVVPYNFGFAKKDLN
ncbi:MAG TPA: hypothetical protein PKK00_11330 [Bacteroidales bacterium]|nr:hypothetical protein [Bacteroidales bacterium]HPS17919.1 hypothetical protein [Bacteroidales bacterium]